MAGVTSGVGKTTVALAIMYALQKRKGLVVQPFKAGPDFIDPSYHTLITGRSSRNLDVWLMGHRGVIDSFDAAVKDADIAVIEGVMGLFDGMSGRDNYASTAHIAKILDAPVILVVDAAKGARSIAAIVMGFLNFDKKNTRIVGLILNNVASDRHACYLKEALSRTVRTPIFGIIRRNREIGLEERHLGLVPAGELQSKKQKVIVNAAKFVADHLNIDAIIAGSSKRGRQQKRTMMAIPSSSATSSPLKEKQREERATIAIALDESFNFYYADNLDALKRSGARLVFFSPVKDDGLPKKIDGLILGGGFPEVLADRLEKNRSMIKSIVKASDEGMPIYGECGGLMYLTRSIKGYKGEQTPRRMIGIVDADTVMSSQLTLNYTEAASSGSIFGKTRIRGHEFHYSKIENIANDSRFAYSLRKGKGIVDGKDGFVVGDACLAGYMHLHFANNSLADRFVRSCQSYSRR